MSKEQTLKPTWTWFYIVPVTVSHRESYVRWSDNDPLDTESFPAVRATLQCKQAVRRYASTRWVVFQTSNLGYASLLKSRQAARDFVKTAPKGTFTSPQQIWIVQS